MASWIYSANLLLISGIFSSLSITASGFCSGTLCCGSGGGSYEIPFGLGISSCSPVVGFVHPCDVGFGGCSNPVLGISSGSLLSSLGFSFTGSFFLLTMTL